MRLLIHIIKKAGARASLIGISQFLTSVEQQLLISFIRT